MSSLPVDEGLLRRLREAGDAIAWRARRPAKGRRPKGGPARVARLHEEEARVELRSSTAGTTMVVESGPVGALVLLLEIDRRGAPTSLGATDAGRDPGFPSGAIVAGWGRDAGPFDSRPTVRDLVELARYALP